MTTQITSRVLVVDDEQAIHRSYAHILTPVVAAPSDESLDRLEMELFGDMPFADYPNMAVTSCDQGEKAVELVRAATASGENFSVAFIDMRMPPGMHGIAAAVEINVIDPAIEIAFVTGYSDLSHEQIMLSFPPEKQLYFVRKPFDGNDMWDLAAGLSLTHAGREVTDASVQSVVQKYRMMSHRMVG